MTRVVRKARLLPEDWEKIILHHTFGKSNNEIAEIIGVTDQAISRTIKVFDYVKAGEWGKLCEMHKTHNVGSGLIDWCAEKTGKTIPDETKAKLESISIEWRNKDAQRWKTTQETKDPDAGGNEDLYMIKILERLAKLEEEHEQLMDVVIPKYINDLKDNINANTDVTCERLKEIAMILEKIAKNTRPRGM